MKGSYYSVDTIEQNASTLLRRYQGVIGKQLQPPISAEHILDSVLHNELRAILWDIVPEPPGRTVLAGLAPEHRLIILNEERKQLFMETPGLYNTQIGHEIGHWYLHVDRANIGQPVLLDTLPTPQFLCEKHASSSWDEKNAHRFMAFMLMPRELVLAHAHATDLTGWSGLYQLREVFDVTITALKIRVEELGLAYVAQDGTFYPSRQEAHGQQRLL